MSVETKSPAFKRWFKHAQARALERYALVYDEQLLHVIKKDVKNNVFNKLLEIEDTDRVVYRGRIQDNVVTFIYSTQHEAVITFLHNNWVETDTSEFFILQKRKGKKHKKSRKIDKGGNLRVGAKARRKLKSRKDGRTDSVEDQMRDYYG